MKKTVISAIIFCCLLCFSSLVFAEKELTISCEPSTNKDLLGYRFYQTYTSFDGNTNTTAVIYDGTQTSYTFTIALPGHYHFIGTAYNSDPVPESEYSNEEYYLYEIPDAPIANAGPSATVNEGDVVALDASATSSSASSLSFLWEKIVGPQINILDDTNEITQFTAPDVNAKTYVIVRLKVTDEHGTEGYATKVVIVNDLVAENEKPIANAGPDQLVAKFSTVTLDSSASSDDKEIVSREWKKIYGGTVSLSDAGAINPTFNAVVGIYIFSVTVTDAEGETSADTVVIKALL